MYKVQIIYNYFLLVILFLYLWHLHTEYLFYLKNEFKYFQQLEGSFRVPQGFKPERVEIREPEYRERVEYRDRDVRDRMDDRDDYYREREYRDDRY